MSGLGKSSRLPVVAVASVVFEAPMGAKLQILCNKSPSSQATKHLASISMVSHPDREVERYFGNDLRIKVELRQPGHPKVVGLGSNPVMSTQEVLPLTSDSQQAFHRSQWEASNRFSLLSNLDWEVDPWFKEEEEVFTEAYPESAVNG